ncbi:hypothetical protein [Flagellimonas zhangzhouensis]|uniref:DUF3575 domain-containing protein n=1 Tax=Flagellimonas zhangzhouensis TaxID=1073328 RepID=A0A1H2QF56_9FLAO|nr:hypothetical protein [Allomuricauda zhangzhouensis]SDQ52493.1 hypothetical protein SAMN05216294_1552 [Allomuricauda zhangzhouensis]SDW05796.1 hypothetical protein SAMN04487892_0203 [Allomuricauda zhangzhouensis]
MKYTFLLFVLCLFPVFSHAQWQERGGTFDLIHLERHQFRLNLLSPGFTYEFGIFKNQSVSTDLGLAAATYEEGYAFGLASNNRYRYYYNFGRREYLGKNTSGNSANYIAAAQAIFFSQLRISTNIEGPKDFNLGFYGLVYGIQRTFKNGFNFNAELGAGFYKGDGIPDGYGPLFNFTFGWVATKRKSKEPIFD